MLTPFARLALRQMIGPFLRRLFCTTCAAVAINVGAAYLLGFDSLGAFWGWP